MQHADLEDDHFADLPKAPPLPGSAYIGTPVRSTIGISSHGTPLAELRQRAASIRATLEAALPKAPTVSCGLEGRELSLAEEAAASYEPTGRDIMHALSQIAKTMVVKEDLHAEMTEALQPISQRLDTVEDQVATARFETKALNERFAEQAAKSANDTDRVAKLESEVAQLKARLSSGVPSASKPSSANDPAFKQISFLGFPSGYSRQGMISEMERAAREKFPECKPVVCEIRYKGPYGKREATLNGYVEFSCPDVRDAALKALGKDAAITVNGTKVSIKPAKTRVDAHRDAMLTIAAGHVKGHAAANGKTVEIVKGNERCVKVNGVIAFQQAARKSSDGGTYAAPFTDLLLPE